MKIRTILFPTDFSETANSALNYTIGIAEKFNASIVLFHSYHLPVIKTDVPMETMELEIDKLEIEALKKLEAISKTITERSPTLNSTAVLKRGFTVENIINTLDDEYIDLIIMGTQGASGFKEILLGSVTADVIAKAECPVLAIPPDAVYSGLSHMVYGIDSEHFDCESLSRAVKFAMSFEAKITVLNVSEPGESIKSKNDLERNVRGKIFYDKIHIEIIETDKVSEGINDYIHNHNVDLLVMATKKRNLFQQLFNPSITKSMAFHLEVPLLALHK